MASTKKKSKLKQKSPDNTMAARKAKKKPDRQPPAVPDEDSKDDGDMTEEESIHEDDVEMDDASIPEINDQDSNSSEEEVKETNDGATTKSKKIESKSKNSASKEPIAFMDTFYQLSSDEPKLRSLAARDLITHCFLSPDGVNTTDAAYALTRLMNGLCTGRAASRQGFASALSTYLRLAHSLDGVLSGILESDSFGKDLIKDNDEATVFRLKLLGVTQFQQTESEKKAGGKMKGMEERDHAFGRLFGILSVVRSGVLGLKEFPSEVTKGYTSDLIELYNYKSWLREPAANAIIELLSTLDAAAVIKVSNEVITPKLLLGDDNKSDREQWLKSLNAEQIAVALHLQKLQPKLNKYSFPIDKAILTADTVSFFAQALAATSNVVYPRCHVVWNVMWVYLTDECDGHRQLREVKGSNEESASVIESIVNHVVVDSLLGKGEMSGSPSNERKSLALQIVSTLTGASELTIVLPPEALSTVLSSDVVNRVFLNVLCASGGIGMKKSKASGGGGDGNAQHHLKSLTSTILSDMVTRCSDVDFIERRLAFVRAFISVDPRFDVRTKTSTVSALLMMDKSGKDVKDAQDSRHSELWGKYLSYLEEAIITADTLHKATMYVELMFKLAKRDMASAPANEARKVIRFFMTAAFFDCLNVASPSASTKQTPSKKKKGKKASTKAEETLAASSELTSAIRIKDILQSHEMDAISNPTRAIMSSRFYSLLSDFITAVNNQSRGGKKSKPFYGNASKPESVYRALSEISGIASVLELSGAKPYRNDHSDNMSDDESPSETSRKHMLEVKKIADEALVNECSGSDDDEMLRARSLFSTGCASLMITLHLQLNCVEEENDDNEEDEEDKEAIHESIADLSEVVSDFSRFLEGKALDDSDEEENPLVAIAGLFINILSSTSGEDSGQTNTSMASASKLTRETVKLAWSGVLSLMSILHANSTLTKNLVDDNFMSTLIESVCGLSSMQSETDDGDDESMEDSDEEEDENDDSQVFSKATDMDLDNDDQLEGGDSVSVKSEDDSEDSQEEELDPSKLENMLLEDSDAEIDVLEHHAGADKALAALIKMKQDTRKASQAERERVELCNRLRCAGLLDSLFSASVLKSGWLPFEAIIGSIIPILRSYKSIVKSIDKPSTSALASKSINEKKALQDRLSSLIQDKLSKFRCSDESGADVESIQKAVADISEEMKHSLNLAHCANCSIALITVIRCIPDAESNAELAGAYSAFVDEWMTRKATKIHTCVFDDLIQRLPSHAAVFLVEPLVKAAGEAHSGYLRCESFRMLSLFYRGDKGNKEDGLSEKAQETLSNNCGHVVDALKKSLCDLSLQKTKNKDELTNAVKHFMTYAKSHSSAVSSADTNGLKDALMTVADMTNSAGMKNTCTKLVEEIAEIAKQPKSSTKKKKKSKK